MRGVSDGRSVELARRLFNSDESISFARNSVRQCRHTSFRPRSRTGRRYPCRHCGHATATFRCGSVVSSCFSVGSIGVRAPCPRNSPLVNHIPAPPFAKRNPEIFWLSGLPGGNRPWSRSARLSCRRARSVSCRKTARHSPNYAWNSEPLRRYPYPCGGTWYPSAKACYNLLRSCFRNPISTGRGSDPSP